MTKKTSMLADVPFYDYLWQFYAQNRKRIRSSYKQLSRKFLDFNDPGDKGGEAFLRRPQFEALEMYVFLKEWCDNARLAKVFRDWQERTGPFEGRGGFGMDAGQLSLFESLDAPKFEAAFSRLQSFAAPYPNYIYALTMGLGKTILMATCIFYEFLLANKYPKDEHFCHNALVFAPDKTVLQSLREIQTFDKSKVVPPGYVDWLNANLKFHYLDDTSLSLQLIENSDFNIVISNYQKIILKRSHKERTAIDSIFAAEKRYEPIRAEVSDPFAGLDDLSNDIETEDDLIANQRFEMLKRLENLGIYVDEGHHLFGNDLKKAFSTKGATSQRRTINELATCLAAAGTRVVACHNYTGTPYMDGMLLPEVVYAYSLKSAIDNQYLKKADVFGYENTTSRAFVQAVLADFWRKYGERRVAGMLPKLAFFASDIAELDGQLRPAVEDELVRLGISTDRILVNVGDEKLTKDEDIREFIQLDTPQSEKQFILLVNKGKEGWNCKSLFGVALHRKPNSRVFVLQATMRCLRAIGTIQETGSIYLSNENYDILTEELQNNFRLNLDEFKGAGETGKVSVDVRMVPPPIAVKLKRIVRRYELRELQPKGSVDFRLSDIDPAKYDVIETKTEIDRVGRDPGVRKVLEGVKENMKFSPLTLTAEIARYLGKSCLDVREALEGSKDGIDALVAAVNRYNELLYDRVVPELFHHFFELDEKTETRDNELKLVKSPKDGDTKGEGEGDNIVATFHVNPDLLASLADETFAQYREKSFHLDNYCFDSKPEMDFFRSVLEDEDVEKVYFTGMLTSDKTEFCVSYIDPESNALRTYYPDFLVVKRDGSYVIVEVKGDHMIDNAIVRAKAESAAQLAKASRMSYQMIPGTKAALGLHS